HFGSLAWNDVKSRYSQPKLELYGLYQALRALQVFLIGAPQFIIEVDASCIKEMLNNLDQQPAAALNKGVSGIHQFDFDLIHIPAKKHTGPDGLS
ncbi:hypothetical protein DACRYDRAFT_43612, partial [Dacryopinax primogenitus]